MAGITNLVRFCFLLGMRAMKRSDDAIQLKANSRPSTFNGIGPNGQEKRFDVMPLQRRRNRFFENGFEGLSMSFVHCRNDSEICYH